MQAAGLIVALAGTLVYARMLLQRDATPRHHDELPSAEAQRRAGYRGRLDSVFTTDEPRQQVGDLYDHRLVPTRFVTGAEGRASGPKTVLNEAEWAEIDPQRVLDFHRDWYLRDDDQYDANVPNYLPHRPTHRAMIAAGPMLNPRHESSLAETTPVPKSRRF